MTERDSDQRSVQDFPETGIDDDVSSDNPGSDDQPPLDDLQALLIWLRSKDTITPSTANELLPELVDSACRQGYDAWTAGNCIDVILDTSPGAIGCPDLIRVLGSEHVDSNLVRENLIEAHPRDSVELECRDDVGPLDYDELSFTERMETYRVLSRMPPNKEVYSKLEEVADFFDDGTVSLSSESYNLAGFFQTYAMRCLLTRIRYPDGPTTECARKALKDFPWSSLRLIAANTQRSLDSDLLEYYVTVIDGKTTPSGFNDGRIFVRLTEGYLAAEDDGKHQLGEVLIAVLGAGVYPTEWQTNVPRLVEQAKGADRGDSDGEVLASIFSAVRNEELDRRIVDDIVKHADEGDPGVWIQSIKVIAEAWPHHYRHHLDTLVSITRESKSRVRSEFCTALSRLGRFDRELVLSKVEPLVNDLSRARSSSEVSDTGHLLEVLDVYPPPPELRDLYGSTNEKIDSVAKQCTASLRKKFRNRDHHLTPGEIDDLETLSQEYSLVRRSGSITWESPRLTSSETEFIADIARLTLTSGKDRGSEEYGLREALQRAIETSADEKVGSGGSLQFVLPEYDPDWFVLAVIGVAFAQIISPETRVTIHSPATSGWGTKKDIKDALSEFGIARGDEYDQPIPLLDLVPPARVTNGEVNTQTTSTTVSTDPPAITIVRETAPLAKAPADLILYNYLPGIDAHNAAQLLERRGSTITGGSDTERRATTDSGPPQSLADQATLLGLVEQNDEETDVVKAEQATQPVHLELYSLFTEQRTSDRRQHIGPPTDLPFPDLVTGTAEHEDEEVGEVEPVADEGRVSGALTANSSQVDLHAVQSEEEIGELLSKIDQYADRVTDPEVESALQRFRYTIGGLPVPVDLHDTWIRNQIDQGNTWVPRRILSRKNGLEALVDEAGFDAQVLQDALPTVGDVIDRLSNANPLFDELLSVLDDAAASDKRVGILCGKKTYKDMLDIHLEERASDWVIGDDLLLLDDHSVRNLSPGDVDWLVTFDPLPPQSAIYYHHPAVEKTVVLGHADGSLESRVYGIDFNRRPYLPSELDAELPELDVTVYGRTREVTEPDRSLTDDLYRTYLSVASESRTENGVDSGSGSGMARYRVVFSDGAEAKLWDAHPMIVRSDEHLVSSGEYVLRGLSRIEKGDEMVHIEPDARRDFWEEFLRMDWDDSEDTLEAEEAFMDAVELWFDAVANGLEAHSESEDLGEGISALARDIEPEVTVEADAVRDWARGVYRADSPHDLVFRSKLRIGPQNADGVKAMAEAYGNDRMRENWEQVYSRIKAIRTTNRQRGSVFWEWLADRACEGDLFDVPGVYRADVVLCEEIE